MKVKFFSESDVTNLSIDDGYYAKSVVVPSTGIVVLDHASNSVIVKNKKKASSLSSSFSSSFFSNIGGAIETIGSPEVDGSKYIQSREEAGEILTRKLTLNEYLQVFRRASRSDTLEYGMVSKCDDLLSSWFAESPIQLGSVISHIFIQSMNDKNLLLSLLKAISNLSYDSIYPFGQTVAVAALVNKDVEVVEGGIRAFENWGSKDGVSVLENTKVAFDWLELYRQQTIAYLREF
ncbi:hypothetical protein [Pseudomonas silesiensis]